LSMQSSTVTRAIGDLRGPGFWQYAERPGRALSILDGAQVQGHGRCRFPSFDI